MGFLLLRTFIGTDACQQKGGTFLTASPGSRGQKNNILSAISSYVKELRHVAGTSLDLFDKN